MRTPLTSSFVLKRLKQQTLKVNRQQCNILGGQTPKTHLSTSAAYLWNKKKPGKMRVRSKTQLTQTKSRWVFAALLDFIFPLSVGYCIQMQISDFSISLLQLLSFGCRISSFFPVHRPDKHLILNGIFNLHNLKNPFISVWTTLSFSSQFAFSGSTTYAALFS